MPKSKSKGSKKSKEPKVELPTLHYGTGTFKMENGDVYEGEYCAHRIGLVWREGKGVYTTHDGQIYTGSWKDDKLIQNEEVTVEYPNGHVFRGRLFKEKYNGPGTYNVRDDLTVSADFKNNQPSGQCLLIDKVGDLWHAIAHDQSKDCMFRLQNYFYENITEERGQGIPKVIKYPKFHEEPEEVVPDVIPEPEKPVVKAESKTSKKKKEKLGKKKDKSKHEVEIVMPVAEEEHKETEEEMQTRLRKEAVMKIFDRNVEEAIFKETTKTVNDIDFTECAWYQDYLKYQTVKEIIIKKLEKGGVASLSKQEKRWCRNYKRFMEIQSLRLLLKELEKQDESSTKLIEEYQSKEYRTKSKAVNVYYPREDADFFYEGSQTWNPGYAPEVRTDDNVFDLNKCHLVNPERFMPTNNFEDKLVQTDEL